MLLTLRVYGQLALWEVSTTCSQQTPDWSWGATQGQGKTMWPPQKQEKCH